MTVNEGKIKVKSQYNPTKSKICIRLSWKEVLIRHDKKVNSKLKFALKNKEVSTLCSRKFEAIKKSW